MNDHAQTETQRGQRASLLLVDDDRLVLATLSDGLREMGYRVSVAASGREAMEAIGRETFDLVILDVRMPGMDGIEVAARLRETGGPPFIFLSAYGDLDIVRQASENGALGYLLKPIDIPQIVPSIEASLVRAAEIGRLRESESRLGNALVIEQKTRTAVGVLMERYRIDWQAAFEVLRHHARSSRRKISECAEDILKAVEQLNKLTPPKDHINRP
ncbi:MAG: response regulator [Betaproteobacteria bacterium]|nr:response regulator [Betaproteobacteria bacterium]